MAFGARVSFQRGAAESRGAQNSNPAPDIFDDLFTRA